MIAEINKATEIILDEDLKTKSETTPATSPIKTPIKPVLKIPNNAVCDVDKLYMFCKYGTL